MARLFAITAGKSPSSQTFAPSEPEDEDVEPEILMKPRPLQSLAVRHSLLCLARFILKI